MNPADDNANFRLELISVVLYLCSIVGAMILVFAMVGLLALRFPAPNGWQPSGDSPVHNPLFPIAGLIGGAIPLLVCVAALIALRLLFYRKMKENEADH